MFLNKTSKIVAFFVLSLGSINVNASSNNIDDDLKMQASTFVTYCMSGKNTFNIISDLKSDNWIDNENSDLIKDKDNRKTFEYFKQNINYGDTLFFTKVIKNKPVYLLVDAQKQICGLPPMIDISKKEMVDIINKNNVNLLKIDSYMGDKETKANSDSYLYNQSVVTFMELKYNNQNILNVFSSSIYNK